MNKDKSIKQIDSAIIALESVKIYLDNLDKFSGLKGQMNSPMIKLIQTSIDELNETRKDILQ